MFLAFPAASSEPVCGSISDILKIVVSDRHMAYLATAITKQNQVVSFYIDREGNWLILGVADDLTSCIIVQGYAWDFAFERAL